jgi:rod shape-determining protein MreC
MQNLYFYRNKSFITLVLLLSISVILMFFNVKLNYLNLRQVLFFVTYPVQYTVSSVGDFFTSSATGISKIRELEEELRMTRISLDKYKKTLLPFSQIQRENEDLKKIIGIKSTIQYNTVYGRIVFRDPGLTGDYFIIDKGAFDGIRPDMPVVSYNDNGDIFLIGKTTEVNASACKIKLLTAADTHIGIELKFSGYVGVLRGNGSWNQNCVAEYIPVEADTFVGEDVITSGESDIFPPGLLVGKIVGIGKPNAEEFFKKLYVRPEFDFSRTRDVFIMEWKPNSDVGNLIEKAGE